MLVLFADKVHAGRAKVVVHLGFHYRDSGQCWCLLISVVVLVYPKHEEVKLGHHLLSEYSPQ